MTDHEKTAQDPAEAFLRRLIETAQAGQRLDDPRDIKVLQRWVGIVRGLPDKVLVQLIPATVRSLLRHPTYGPQIEACGLTPDHPMQHEAIAAYVASYRRFEKRRQDAEERDESSIIKKLLTAEISVETHWASLDALGLADEAEDTARGILGEHLFELYGEGRQPATPSENAQQAAGHGRRRRGYGRRHHRRAHRLLHPGLRGRPGHHLRRSPRGRTASAGTATGTSCWGRRNPG